MKDKSKWIKIVVTYKMEKELHSTNQWVKRQMTQ